MSTPNEVSNHEPTPDDVGRALEAFHRGSTTEFEQLLDDFGECSPSVVKLLRELIDQGAGPHIEDPGPESS